MRKPTPESCPVAYTLALCHVRSSYTFPVYAQQQQQPSNSVKKKGMWHFKQISTQNEEIILIQISGLERKINSKDTTGKHKL